jgi:hypothetical protein
MEKIMYITLAITIALSIVFIAVRTLKGGLAAFLTKTLASFSLVASTFVVMGLVDSQYKLVMALIGIGLLCGMIGDMVLDLKVIYDNDKVYLNSGMLSFGLGHISYFIGLTFYAVKLNINLLLPILISVGGAILLTAGTILSSKTMKLDFGKYLWQTISYSFALTFMAIYSLMLAINGGVWLLFVGFVLFFLSDIVLSFQYFGGKIKSKPLIVINHALYYSAQIVIFASMFLL